MKTTNLYMLLAFFLIVIALQSCVQDDEYDLPILVIESVDIPSGQLLDIRGVRSLLDQEIANTGDVNSTLTFETDNDNSNDKYIMGFVVSNDFSSNFFEELIIQDKASNPTAGIKVLIDASPLSATYEFGRKVFIRLDGLTIGYDSGVLALGIQEVNSVGKISEAAQRDFLYRDDEVIEIVPLPILMDEFTDGLTNLYIRLNDVQFNRNELSKTFAGEPLDQFDGERSLEECGSGITPPFNTRTIFSTSTFADFKGVTLPTGRGSIDAILTKDFRGSVFNIVINDPSTINFDNSERCDPVAISCSNDEIEREIAVYTENFEQFEDIEDYEAIGWANINISGGNEVWDISSFGNNGYARVSGFGSEEVGIDTWLITPGIDMDTSRDEELNFQIQAAYDNGIGLTVLISNDFLGDVATANWQFLDVTMPIGPVNSFGDFVQLEPIDLSCLDGTIHIAFRYEGSDPGVTTRYHVNNIVIMGN